MDPEPVEAQRATSQQGENFSGSSAKSEIQTTEEEDPFGFSGPSIALIGFIISISIVGTPLAVILVDSPPRGERVVPTEKEIDGSQTSPPFSFKRSGQFSR